MKALFKWTAITTVVLAVALVALLAGGFALLNTHWLQQKMLTKAVSLLTEKLQTRVAVDSVSIDLLTLDAKLYGLTVEDRQRRPMFGVEFVKTDVDISALLSSREIRIRETRLEGIRAELYKAPKGSESPDTVANYQFLIDAFKPSAKSQPKDTTATAQKRLAFAMNTLRAERIDIVYNGQRVQLGQLHYDPSAADGRLIELQRLHLKTDNHRQRKNSGRPKRGAFDTGHLNVWADMKLKVDSVGKGMVHGYLTDCTLCDTLTGIDIRRLQCEVTFADKTLKLNDVHLQQGETELHFNEGVMHLPDSLSATRLHYATSTISGTAVLRDISTTFAPVLSQFTLPLQLSVRIDGDDSGLRFHDIVVKRPAGKLLVKATGYAVNLKDKHRLKLHFDVHKATFVGGEKERIINQFRIKKFMMKQLHQLGTIHYTGSFDIIRKREEFRGDIQTEAGKLKFSLAIDGARKYLLGEASTDHLEIGHVMDMPDIKAVAASAQFKFDISKARTALMRRRLGGKLPIGEVTAHVDQASYKFVKMHNLDVQMASDGATAVGNLCAPRKLADMDLDFTFTNTSEMRKMKVKPRLKLHLFKKKKKSE